MAFNSLDHLLNHLTNKAEWSEYQRYQAVCDVWHRIIQPKVVVHTRPLSIHRNIFWVATSSAAWAQQLSLQHYSLLKQLNTYLATEPLANIRFSSAQWFQSQGDHKDLLSDSSVSLSSHPSFLESLASYQHTGMKTTQTPEEAFQQWSNTLQSLLEASPLCPQCHRPTPQGELKRWSKCSLCMIQDLP
ncbi:MAG: DciA family protein [Cyanobacteria bacterium P01_G01_bin.49]